MFKNLKKKNARASLSVCNVDLCLNRAELATKKGVEQTPVSAYVSPGTESRIQKLPEDRIHKH